MMPLVTILCGAVVGLSLGLTGGGGALFAVPLLVYVLAVDPRQAVGVSLATVGATAAVGFIERSRAGSVELRAGLLFAAAGMVSAPLGAWLAAQMPESLLLVLFSVLMLVIAARMGWRAGGAAPQPAPGATDVASPTTCRRDPQGALLWNSRCALLLSGVGLGTGVLTGMFGVGGGFIVVPALVVFSGLGLQRAIGTSLLVIALISASGTASYILAGREIPWLTAAWFAAGGLLGMLIGGRLASRLGGARLQQVFAAVIVLVAAWIIAQNLVD